LSDHLPPTGTPKVRRRLLRWTTGLLFVVAALLTLGNIATLLREQSRWHNARADCQRAETARDWPSLEEAARVWLELDSANGDAWLFLARASEELGKPLRAASALSCVPDSHPRISDALRRQVELDLGVANRPLEAESALHRLLHHEPNDPQVHQGLIDFYARTFQKTRLVQQIRDSMASRCEPIESYLYLATADAWWVRESLPVYQRWIGGHPDCPIFTTAHALCLAHQDPITAGNPQRLADALDRFGDNAELLAYHIEQSLAAGDSVRVGRLLDQAPRLTRSDYRFWRYAAWYQYQQGLWEEAENAFRQSLELNPLSWKTRRCLADFLTDQERHDEARRERQLADEGAALEREVLKQSVRESPSIELLEQIAAYAATCEDFQVVDGISRHLPTATPLVSKSSQDRE
jgi:tetratricopeptide (TPR) repeat protein